MFNRNIIQELEKWRDKKKRKPLVLRGARQVGKTTVIEQFSKKFKQYIYLNLELASDRRAFEEFTDIETLVQTIFFSKNKELFKSKDTLIFIDEIQEVSEAFNTLRYFYEKRPEIAVIAAGSMLETIFDNKLSFPVGRVDFLVLRPVSFPEFLEALGEKPALEQLKNIPLKTFAFDKLIKLFHTYALIGGMPEIVSEYVQSKDLTALGNLYEGLIVSYIDDVEKYADNNTQINVIRHVIKTSYLEAGKRIKFQGFGKSNYGSREVGEALRTLEKTFLLHLLYPTSGIALPILPELQKSPRLQVLDTGLLNYFTGLQKEVIGTSDLQSVHQGLIIEHLVGQELLAEKYNALSGLNFWVREKNTSSAEVDYLHSYNAKLIPVEVKSGKTGKLRSLHLFMDGASHNMAVRFHSGQLSVGEVITPAGKKFYLMSLPYFLVSQLEKYLDWFEEQISSKKKKKA
ncbi:MAG: AAA family ATPase [Bacteroidota bacterium]|nr:AAA family ATPase [Bacteroidota bacterium]